MSEEWERGLAEAQVAEAAAERRRARRELDLLDAEASVEGVLVAAATRPAGGHHVTLTTVIGTEHRGEVVAVGPDAVVLRNGDTTVIVARAALAAIGVSGPLGRTGPEGAVRSADGPLLAELLAEVADRGEVVLVRAGAASWSGTVSSVGEDVAVLDPGDGSRRYLRLESVSSIAVSAAS